MNILIQIYSASIYGNTPLFSSVNQLFSDESLVKYILHVGGILAQSQGELNIIPNDSGQHIFKLSQTDFIDLKELINESAQVGIPIVGVITQFTRIAGDHGKYLHWGATTQDIMDTALILQLKNSIQQIDDELRQIITVLAEMTKVHRHTIMVGRSQMQHALRITFGFKTALWIASLLHQQELIQYIKKHSFYLQFGGAVGTLASVNKALELKILMAQKLGLKNPVISWHSSRESIVEIMHRISSLSGSLGKIGVDISLMS